LNSIRNRLNQLYNKADQTPPEKLEQSLQIRRELERLYSKEKVKYFAKTKLEQDNLTLPELVRGSWINTNFGDIFRGEYEFDMTNLYGNLNLNKIYNYNSTDFQTAFNIDGITNQEKLLFIDTETTGLAGGSGTVAFMIGVGWIQQNVFHVHQYFITELSHEEGMLELIGNLKNKFDCLVSYNGKSYDIPLLNTRFIMNRLSPVFSDFSHIDLLHPTRSLWKYSMTNCKLKTVECELLDLFREEDIPGELIPQVYFDYLKDGNPQKIERIFYHNRFDIITMLANLILIMKSYQSVLPEKNPLTEYAKGKIFYRKNNFKRSITHYKYVLDSDISDTRRQKTMLELAEIYKKEKNYPEAIILWKSAINETYPFFLEPFIELAKYYEHYEKNYQIALDFVNLAEEKIPARRAKDIQNIENRKNRLISKSQKLKNKRQTVD